MMVPFIIATLLAVLLALLLWNPSRHGLETVEGACVWWSDISYTRPTWQPLKILGDGEFAEVFLVRNPEQERSLAVKVLREKYRDDCDIFARFVDEATLMRIAEPSGVVPPVLDSDFEANRPWFAMYAVENGGSLDAQLAASPGVRLRRRLAASVADAVARVHARGVIHRDLCPRNLLVETVPALRTWVIDFGVGKGKNVDACYFPIIHEGTMFEGCFMGKQRYAAPEILPDRLAAADYRSDVFALGVILFRTITLTLPHTHEGKYRPLRHDFNQKLADAGLSGVQIGLLKHSLDQEPSGRPTAAQLAAALQGYA